MSFVYFIGREDERLFRALTERLRPAGVGAVRVASGDFSAVSSGARDSAVVLLCPDEDCIEKVLAWSQRSGSRLPVVVLVETADFGQYYRLMSDGAWGYFSLDDDLDSVARGIARAVQVAGG